MYIYLLKTDEGKKIIEYNKYEGITERCERPGGWGISRSISKNAKNCFFAYCDKFKNMHIVTVSKNQELLYLTYKNNRWHEYKIANIKEGIEIKKIMIGDTNICKNLFYSALYNGEYILVHCVLGNMAQPSTIDKMYDENFFVNRGRIIYTNKDFNVGFRSFSDGKPDNFIIIGNGNMPYEMMFGEKRFITYKNNNDIYLNGGKIITSSEISTPVINSIDGDKILMWKSGDFIKYMSFEESNQKKSPMQYMSNGIKPQIFVVSNGENTIYFYGTFSNNKINIFSKTDPFESLGNNKKGMEYQMIKIHELYSIIKSLNKEIQEYKMQIQKLNILIDSILKDDEKDLKL